MATHDVKFVVPERPVGNVDIQFIVKRDSKKLGTLKVSRGGVEWLPKDHSYGFNMNWKMFDQFMQTNGMR